MGGGTPRATTAGPTRPDRPRAPVIPAPAGTRAGRNPPSPTSASNPIRPPSPIHPSPLPGGRLGGGWEPRTTTAGPTRPDRPPRPPPSVIPAQAGTTAPHFPQLLLRSHQNRSAEPCPPPRNAVNPNLANSDQNLTELDTRLTKVDKTYHRQPLRRTPNNPEQP